MKTVAHILPGCMYGGFETLCLQMIRASAHVAPDVQHVVINTGPQWHDGLPMFAQHDIPVIAFPFVPSMRNTGVQDFARLLWGLKPNGLVIYDFATCHWVIEAARRAEVRNHVVHVGAHPVLEAYKAVKEIAEAPDFQDAPLIFCSYSVEKHFRSICTPPPRSATIRNGVDVEGIAAEAGRKRVSSQGPAPKSPTFGMVARLVKQKGWGTLIEAYGLAYKAIQAGELQIVGDGEYREELMALAADTGAPIRFLGNRVDVPALLGGMDIYVFAALPEEGLGNSLVEAMAAGLPIIATDAPSCVEVLSGVGRLVPCRDVGAMAKAMVLLASEVVARNAYAHSKCGDHRCGFIDTLGMMQCDSRDRAKLFDVRITARGYLGILGVLADGDVL